MSQDTGTRSLKARLDQARALYRAGRLDEAAQAYRTILQAEPAQAETHRQLATIGVQLGRPAEALAAAQRALALGVRDARILALMGQALLATGRTEAALDHLDRAVAENADDAEAHYHRALALRRLGHPEPALAALDRAMALRPDLVALHGTRGDLLHDLGRNDEALESVERLLAHDTENADAHANRGVLLDEAGRVGDALESYARALALRPDLPAALAGRGQLRLEAGDLRAARHDLEEAARLAPASRNTRHALARIQLLQGDWLAAWPNYEFRYDPQRPTFAMLPFPRWNGEAPGGYRLVLVTEQGSGDIIQSTRFAPRLAAQGHRVTLLALPALVPLLSSLRGVEVVEQIEMPRNAAIRWAPLMSVPGIEGLTVETIPAETPYLFAQPERVARWRTKLGDHSFKIAVAWQGKPHFRVDRGRSMPLAALASLAALPGVRLISLQKGAGVEQIDTFTGRIETLGPEFDENGGAFLDTAAVMELADLVVTTDTSIAHLAGALRRPTFVALQMIPEWRWLLGRDDTPWYPDMRLFRQTEAGDWAGVGERIAAAVTALRA